MLKLVDKVKFLDAWNIILFSCLESGQAIIRQYQEVIASVSEKKKELHLANKLLNSINERTSAIFYGEKEIIIDSNVTVQLELLP